MKENGATPAILAADVHKRVKSGERELHIIRGIDLRVPRAQVLAIIGPSGSGKSTLMGLLGGLDTPTTGHIYLDGTDIAQMNESKLTDVRNEKIGFVFQSFHLIPTLSAIQNVALPLRFAAKPKYDPIPRAIDVLNLLGLGDRLKHRPAQLSGGQQQRVAIARALANDPPILLCDEPTGNLDTQSGQQVIEALQSIRENLQTTVIVVTHDAQVAEQMDRIVTLEDGKLVEDRIVGELVP